MVRPSDLVIATRDKNIFIYTLFDISFFQIRLRLKKIVRRPRSHGCNF